MAVRRSQSYALLVGVYFLSLLASADVNNKPTTPEKRGPMSVQAALRILRERRKEQYLLNSGLITTSLSSTSQAGQDVTTATVNTVTTRDHGDNLDSSQIRSADLISTTDHLERPLETELDVEYNVLSPKLYDDSQLSGTARETEDGAPVQHFPEKNESNFESMFNVTGENINTAPAISNYSNPDTDFSQDLEKDLFKNSEEYNNLENNTDTDGLDNFIELKANSSANMNVSIQNNLFNNSNFGENLTDFNNSKYTSTVDDVDDSSQNASVYHIWEEISDLTSDETDRSNLTSPYRILSSASTNSTSTHADISKSPWFYTEQNSTESNSSTGQNSESPESSQSTDNEKFSPENPVFNLSTEYDSNKDMFGPQISVFNSSTQYDSGTEKFSPQNSVFNSSTQYDSDTEKFSPQNSVFNLSTEYDSDKDMFSPQNSVLNSSTQYDSDTEKFSPQNSVFNSSTQYDSDTEKFSPQNSVLNSSIQYDSDTENYSPQNSVFNSSTEYDSEISKSSQSVNSDGFTPQNPKYPSTEDNSKPTVSPIEDFLTTVASTKSLTTFSERPVSSLHADTLKAQHTTSESQTAPSPGTTVSPVYTSRPTQTTSGYMYRTTEYDPLTNRGGPFLRKPNAYDFLMMGQIATAQRNEKQREFRESNYEASAQICALFNKSFCRLSIGGRCC